MSDARQWLLHAYRTPVALASPYPPAECLRRVQAELASIFSFSNAAAKRKLVGSASANSISVRFRIDYRNDFRRVLNLTFVPIAGGSEAHGSFVVSPFLLAFLVVFCGFTGTIALGMLTALLKGDLALAHTSADFVYLIPVGMFLFAPALTAFGLALSRKSERQALEVLRELLDTTELTPPPPRV